MLSEHVEVSRKLGGLVGAAAATAGVYGLILRPRMVRWGATDDELKDPYPGRELVPDGIRTATMAVTIAAPPAKVWPWLIQMGYDRAGYYSWDHLDNGGRPSAKGIHPEWQDLSVGDHLSAMSPTGPMDAWEVAALEPERFLGLRGLTDLRGRNLDPAQPRPSGYLEGLWGFLLKELPDHRTRLVVGGYQAIRPRWLERLVNFWFFPPIHWTMQTRQFTNLTRNIESDQQKAGKHQQCTPESLRPPGLHAPPVTGMTEIGFSVIPGLLFALGRCGERQAPRTRRAKAATAQTTAAVAKRITRSPLTGSPRVVS